MDYKISPGVIVKEYIDAKDLNPQDIEKKVNLTENDMRDIYNGEQPITLWIAEQLSELMPDTQPEFWLDLQKHYDKEE